MDTIKTIILVGQGSAGKSTLALQLKERFESDNQFVALIRMDDIVCEITEDNRFHPYCTDEYLTRIHTATMSEPDYLILDFSNEKHTRKMIYDVIPNQENIDLYVIELYPMSPEVIVQNQTIREGQEISDEKAERIRSVHKHRKQPHPMEFVPYRFRSAEYCVLQNQENYYLDVLSILKEGSKYND